MRARSTRASVGTRARPSKTTLVSPGQWIRIPVPGEPFPVHMRVGMAPERPAFIDHEPDGQTVAAIRCPAIPPGDHEVFVRLPGGDTIAGNWITVPSP